MKYTKYIVPLVLFLAAACQKEVPSEAPNEAETTENEIVISARIEGQDAATRVEINTANGICRWRQNDLVGIWATNGKAAGEAGAFNQYKVGAVVDGAVRLTLSGDQYRAGYAVYPYDVCVNAAPGVADGEKLQVTYPTVYNCGPRTTGAGKAPLATWCPAPMVSVNTEQKTEYDFYHVGAVLTLTLTDVPAGTNKIVVTFIGDSSDPENLLGDITGNFEVTDPGTKDATLSLVSGTGNAITFKNLEYSYEPTMVFNIPLPSQGYNRLQAINVAATGGSVACSVSKLVEGWGALSRAQGRKLTIDFNSIEGGQGTFRGYYIHPGILVWDQSLNGGDGDFRMTDGSDPLELLRYRRLTDEEILGVYCHITARNNISLKYRFDHSLEMADISSPYVVVDGLTWKVPSRGDWQAIIQQGEASVLSSITINTNNRTDAANNYRTVLVDLSDATDVNGIDYSSLGFTTETGTAGTDTGYIAGLLLFPDGAVVSCPGITGAYNSGYTANRITYSVLRLFLDGGCLFIPSVGMYDWNHWTNTGTHGGATLSSFYSKDYSFCLWVSSGSVSFGGWGSPGVLYQPVWMVRQSQ